MTAGYTNPLGLEAFLASEDLLRGERVKINFAASNEPTIAKADVGEPSHGVMLADCDSGKVGTVDLDGRIVKRRTGGAVTQYADVYAVDDGRVDDGGSGDYQGIALNAAAAAGEIIAVLEPRDLVGFGDAGELVENVVAASTAVTAVGPTTFDNGSKTIDGASLRVGDILRVKLAALWSATTGTETANLKLLFGTEEIVATGAVDVANNDIGVIEADIVIRELGATGKVVASGFHALGVPGTVTAKPFFKAEATEDISGDVAVSATVTHSNTGESVTLQRFTVEHIRK